MRPRRASRTLFSSILCPVDFSEHSGTALRYALTIGQRLTAKVHALYVNDPLLVAAAATAFTPQSLARTSLKELRTFVDRTARTAGASATRVVCEVAQGDPATEIDKAARRRKADLVVVGTQGLSGPKKLLFGSTTARALERTKVPILAVPTEAPSKPSAATWPGNQVMVAVDLGSQTAADIRTAASVAQAFGTRLLITHIVKPLQVPGWLSSRTMAYDQRRLDAARNTLEQHARALDPSVNAECHVSVGTPGDSIPAVASETGTGLIIVVLRAESGVFGAPQGSITYEALGHATVPILAIPGKTRRTNRRRT